MALTMRSYSPRAQVRIWTKAGDFFDATGDLVSFTTHRSTDGSPGTWTLSLVARKVARGDTYANLVRGMDYIEIWAGNGPGPMGVRMRGFVDNAMQGWSIGQSGGPIRTVDINGRDYTKMFLEDQIRYVWQNDPQAAMVQSWGLTQTYGINPLISTTSDFCTAIVQQVFGQYLSGLRSATKMPVRDITLNVTVPDEYGIPMLVVEPFTGSFWSLFTYFQSPPLGECFLWDAPQGPVLTFRVAPLVGVDGKLLAPAVPPALGKIYVDLTSDQNQDVGYSDNEVANYFFVAPDASPLGSLTDVIFTQTGINPLNAAGSQLVYGFRPLEVHTPWLTPFANSGEPNVQPSWDQVATLAAYLQGAYDHAEILASGSIQVHGLPDLMPGRYVVADQLGLVFYCQTVDEIFNAIGSSQPSWTATLGVVRGQGL